MLASAPSQRAHGKPEVPVYYSYDGPEQSEQSQSHSPATPADMNDGPEVYHLRINLQEGGGSSDPGSYDSGIQNDMPSPADTQSNQYDDAMDLDEMDVDQEEGYDQQQESSYYQPSKSPSLMPGTGATSAIGSGMASYMNSSDEGGPEPMPPPAKIPEMRHQESTPTQSMNPRAHNELSFGADDELFAEQVRAHPFQCIIGTMSSRITDCLLHRRSIFFSGEAIAHERSRCRHHSPKGRYDALGACRHIFNASTSRPQFRRRLRGHNHDPAAGRGRA